MPAAPSPILISTGSSGEWGAHGTEDATRCMRLVALRKSGFDFSMADALVRGSIGHVGLAHHYARKWARENGENEESFYPPKEAMRLEAEKLGGTKFLSLLSGLYDYYAQTYEKEVVEVVSLEEVYSAEIPRLFDVNGVAYGNSATRPPPWKHTQRIDLVARERDGKIYLWDHKFLAEPTADGVVETYSLSVQFVGLQYLGRLHFGKEFGGVRVNAIGHRNGKLVRELIPPAPGALKNFPYVIDEARRRVEFWKKADPSGESWPKALSETVCKNQYGICGAFKHCKWK